MDIQELSEKASQPEVIQMIVGDYQGQFSLGVTDNPIGYLLRVSSKDVSGFPQSITLNGEEIPVVVRGSSKGVLPQ